MILCDGSKQIVDTDSDLAIRTLSQDLNQHAAAVLEGRSQGRICGFIPKYFGFFFSNAHGSCYSKVLRDCYE